MIPLFPKRLKHHTRPMGCSSTGWGLPAWRAAGRGGPAGAGGWKGGHGPAVCPCSRGQQLPGLRQAEHCQQAEDEEGDPALQLSTGETCLNCWVSSTREIWSWSSEGPLRCLRDSSSDTQDEPVRAVAQPGGGALFMCMNT